jgi:hypothetical protein
MADDTVTLEFIARRLDAIQIEMRTDFRQMRDEITVLTGMAQRAEGVMIGLTTEIAGLRSMLLHLSERVRKVETSQ